LHVTSKVRKSCGAEIARADAMSEVNGLWIGPRLSPLERACVQSFLSKGHTFNLYVYEDVLNVPSGCALRDAGSIVARSHVFTHSSGPGTGSLAGFSDLFRYKLLYEQGGWWTDLDVFCLSPLLPELPIVIGRQDAQLINGAILKFPPQHPAMQRAYEECLAKGPSIDWAEIGPVLLTQFVEHGHIVTDVLPTTTFYPLHFSQFWAAFDPRRTAHAAQLMQSSTCLHLWNEMIRRNGIDKNVLPPEGSLLRNFYEWTIGTAEFTQEYRLATNCPADSLALELIERAQNSPPP
jgi:hypothetical protein